MNQKIPCQASSILLLCIGTYLSGEYGKWGNISWEGIFGGILMLLGFFFYIFFSEMKQNGIDVIEEKNEAKE